ncbi:SdpI family protein [Bacillus pacificus]|uniref:SdpI family protein n=1 Tax=Bacillus pacificus TaxID=2026187 RepID=UPI00156B1DD9|nr:SdpI family protein [Bacillus pacificus]MDA1908382.1 SdpI family protein [Bacillus cereus]MDA2167808.1 SdpI family protein [Bacillus cereus]NRR13736.1 SdpI family protein [Bacillus pacificus]
MKKHLVAIILILITGLAWAYAWPNLPDTMAVHWGMEGVNGYASKFNAMLLLLGIMIFTYVLLTITPKIDPKKKNYDKFSKGYMIINYSVVVLLFLVNMLIIGVGLGYDIPMNSTPLILVGLLFIVIGNYLPQCKPNYFVGIKTPWTLSNEEVWRKTHRFSGKVFVVLGIIMILSVFVPVTWKSFIMVGIIIGAVGLTMGYSYVAYKKELKM